MFSTLILLLPSIFTVRPLEDDFRQILLHLKPQKADGAIEIKTQLDDLYRVINTNFDESNISAFYDVAYNDTKFSNFALSIFHNWGLGVEEDDRIAVLRLNLGVLEDDLISFLSFNHKSLLGLNVPKSCQANLRTYKNIVNAISHRLSLFERKEGHSVFVNSNLEVDNNDLIQQIALNLDEIKRTNPKQLNKFIEYYIGSASAQTDELNQKIIKFLKSQSFSPPLASYLGMIYLKFFDHDENYIKEAYKLFKESEDIPYSHLGFGILYFYGLGVETNYTIAFQHFIQANRSGLVEASTYLAISYLMGLGVTPDSQQALKSAMVAANRGYLLALYALGFMHEKGIGVFHSCRYAAEMYSVIIEHKLLKNYVSEAVRDYQNGQVLRALFKFLIFSEMGSSYALINAAGIIEKHKFKFFGSENRLKKLFKIWKHAAMLGNPKATIKVGDCYFYGIGVEQSYKEAYDFYKTAAISYREPEAMFNLGYMYEHGYGIRKNFNIAENFYMVSSEFDSKIKTMVSFVLLKLRLKKMYERFGMSIQLFQSSFKENVAFVAGFVKRESENLLIVTLTLVFIVITKFHMNMPNRAR